MAQRIAAAPSSALSPASPLNRLEEKPTAASNIHPPFSVPPHHHYPSPPLFTIPKPTTDRSKDFLALQKLPHHSPMDWYREGDEWVLQDHLNPVLWEIKGFSSKKGQLSPWTAVLQPSTGEPICRPQGVITAWEAGSGGRIPQFERMEQDDEVGYLAQARNAQ